MEGTDFSLGKAHVAVIGLGLMGGSLALALKGHCRKLSAVEPQADIRKYALQNAIVDEISDDPAAILGDADLVILACPVFSIIEWISNLPQYIQKTCVVMDIGSTKEKITEVYKELPENFDPIGTHPICGKEKLSIQNADQELFQGAPFLLTKIARTTDRAQHAAVQIAKVIGAKSVWVDAQLHDRMLAATSHLPYLVASTLASTTSHDAIPFIGPGFRSSTRLAATPSSMMLSVLQTNRDNVLEEIQCFKEQLKKIEDALQKDDSAQLAAILDAARAQNELITG